MSSSRAKVPTYIHEDHELQIKINNLMQTTTDMIYFKDLNSVFTLCSNSTTANLTGGLEQSIIGKSDFDFFDLECAERFFHDEQEIIRTGEPIIGKIESEIRNGENTWVFSSKLPLRNESGEIIGTFGVSRDITEQKKTELKLKETHQQLVDASRRAGMAEIATNVIHNVGNVLTSVQVAVAHSDEICGQLPYEKIDRVADLIEQHANDDGFFRDGERGSHVPEYLRALAENFRTEQTKIRKELADTRRHLNHISNIVAQQQQHTGSELIETVDLSELITDAIMMSSSSLEQHNIAVVRDFEEGLVAETDKHRVLAIIVNLIRNAKHACQDSTAKERWIKVSVDNDSDGSFSISISDNGIGIEKDNMVRLFTHGFTTREQGNGFGLHSGANSARQLGGSISVFSEGPNQGATFVLTLPGKLK